MTNHKNASFTDLAQKQILKKEANLFRDTNYKILEKNT